MAASLNTGLDYFMSMPVPELLDTIEEVNEIGKR